MLAVTMKSEQAVDKRFLLANGFERMLLIKLKYRMYLKAENHLVLIIN
jgi:hypothetical protein